MTTALLPLILVLAFYACIVFLGPRLKARKCILREVDWTLNDADVHLSSDVANAVIQWKAFIRFKESNKVFLLFVQKGQAHFIPKRILTEPQIAELRALLAQHVPAK